MRIIDADKLYPDRMTDKGLAISQSQIANAETINAIPLNNIVELPKDEVVYGYISKQFPTTNVFFDSYETALNSAIHDQPKHRPFYMIKATRHFEFCGIVEKDEVKHD